MDTINKVKLQIKIPSNVKFEYNGETVEVIPFIDFSDEILLINSYVKDYFDETKDIAIEKSKYHVFEAECRLMNYIIQLNTNIDMQDVDSNIYADSILWNKITDEIYNYEEFRKKLDSVVYEIKEQIKLENSLGLVLSNLLDKVEEFADQINKFSPEDVKELQDTGKEMIQELEKTSILRNPSDLIALETPLVEEIKKE